MPHIEAYHIRRSRELENDRLSKRLEQIYSRSNKRETARMELHLQRLQSFQNNRLNHLSHTHRKIENQNRYIEDRLQSIKACVHSLRPSPKHQRIRSPPNTSRLPAITERPTGTIDKPVYEMNKLPTGPMDWVFLC